MDSLPTEIILMIYGHLDAISQKNFIMVCKRFLNIILSDPKITPKGLEVTPQYLKIQPKEFRYDADFINGLLLNWPFEYLKLDMSTCRRTKVSKFLENVKFENCETLESVDVETDDLTRHFFPGRYSDIKTFNGK